MTTTAWKSLVLTGYFGTFILIVAWYGWLSPPVRLPAYLALLALGAPLLLPLRGLLHGRPYTYAWSLFLALGYAAHALIEVFSTPTDRGLALLELAMVLMWFVGAVGYVRQGRARKP
ncbi:MAG: DUF2069 domain-containing protein [Gammaproteobacteria bacterium]|nr:DUF2069 domain-containing protein [Gammaproteobacteria bacterium]